MDVLRTARLLVNVGISVVMVWAGLLLVEV